MNIKVRIRSLLRWMASNPACSAMLNFCLLRAARSYREQVYRQLQEGEPPPTELVEKLRQDAIVRHGPFAGTRYPTKMEDTMGNYVALQYLAGLAANQDQRFLIFQSILDYRRYPADLFVASADTEAQLRSWYANAPQEGGARQR
jgi:hypothetical protein